MPSRAHNGFTLVELLVALILLVIVGGGIYRVLIVAQQVSTRQTETGATAGAVRSGMQLIQSELQEIATGSTATAGSPTPWSDVVTANSNLIRYKAMRGVGVACEISTGSVKVRQANFQGLHIPTNTRDEVLLFMDGDSTKITDDHWRAVGFTSTASTCPDGAASWTLSFGTALSTAARDSIWVPSPIRTMETMEIGIVNDAGQDWLGIRSVTGGEAALLPAVGPITSGGLSFVYKDKNGGVAGSTLTISTIQMTLTGVTDRLVRRNASAGAIGNDTQALSLIIQLRNSR